MVHLVGIDRTFGHDEQIGFGAAPALGHGGLDVKEVQGEFGRLCCKARHQRPAQQPVDVIGRRNRELAPRFARVV